MGWYEDRAEMERHIAGLKQLLDRPVLPPEVRARSLAALIEADAVTQAADRYIPPPTPLWTTRCRRGLMRSGRSVRRRTDWPGRCSASTSRPTCSQPACSVCPITERQSHCARRSTRTTCPWSRCSGRCVSRPAGRSGSAEEVRGRDRGWCGGWGRDCPRARPQIRGRRRIRNWRQRGWWPKWVSSPGCSFRAVSAELSPGACGEAGRDAQGGQESAACAAPC